MPLDSADLYLLVKLSGRAFTPSRERFCAKRDGRLIFSTPRNDKALNNQGFVVSNMAEAMGFELMDLLQSTVFKSEHYSLYINGIDLNRFRLVMFINAVEPFEIEGWKFNCGNDLVFFLLSSGRLIALNFLAAIERLRLVKSGFYLQWDLESAFTSRDGQKLP